MNAKLTAIALANLPDAAQKKAISDLPDNQVEAVQRALEDLNKTFTVREFKYLKSRDLEGLLSRFSDLPNEDEKRSRAIRELNLGEQMKRYLLEQLKLG
ncbi:hypothetical protein JF535_14975 [Microbulbifer salipaludis]|uniref:Uncharacterized protein n=1 Tax=Microbulbifer salipaludis TaxID=187980 RepID=A0ABS3EA06_9GAMM|nr:hypothetical protein [Microbulbifer salipaludis]MBN8432153.1 hypothetical protein [Microbulbifer salipaludis]